MQEALHRHLLLSMRSGTRLVLGTLVLAWFLSFSYKGIVSDFTADDMMNLDHYVQQGFGRTIGAAVRTITPYYRPLGGVFYLIFFRIFGLVPLPYRIACFVLLITNLYLFFQFFRLISRRNDLPWIAAFLASYHAWFIDLYYSTGTIYELLCVFFYMMAMNTYIKVRSSGRSLVAGHWLAILICYAAALNSKELAVTLPLILGIYELIYHRPRSYVNVGQWLVGECRMALVLALVTIPYLWVKTHSGSLASNVSYQPKISATVWMHTFQIYVNPLLYQDHQFRGGSTILLLAILLIVAIASNLRYMTFGWCWLFFSVLPFIFLPHYAAFFLYLPAVGWVTIAAGLILMLRDGIMAILPRTFSQDIFNRRSTGAFVLAALMVPIAFILASCHRRETEVSLKQFMSVQAPISPLIRGLREHCPAVGSGGVLWFRNDPFGADTHTLEQAVRLACRDRTLTVIRGGEQPEGALLTLTYDGAKLGVEAGK